MAIYLDPLTKDDGCLRVIPASNRRHDPDHLSALREGKYDPDGLVLGMRPDEIPSVALETEPGDVLVFTEGTIHAAFGGGVGRHQICVSFVENPKTERHLNQIMAFYGNSTWSLRPTRSYVESDRPRIRRMVQKPLEWGFEVIEY